MGTGLKEENQELDWPRMQYFRCVHLRASNLPAELNRIPDISQILKSQERLDRAGLADGDPDNTTDSETIGGHSMQGPNGKQYHLLPVINDSSANQALEPAGNAGDVYEQGLCGIGFCQPRWSQCLANLNVFVIAYGIAGIWMITLNSLLGSQITSIERHLGISSSKAGMILSSNEFGYLLVVIIGSHLGKYSHIPRCLSASGVVFGLATLAMSFGRLMEPRVWQDTPSAFDVQMNISGNHDSTSKYLCNIGPLQSHDSITNTTGSSLNATASTPDLSADFQESALPLNWAFWLIVVASAVGGAVKSYRMPLLTYYIESNIVNREQSALLLGISLTAMVFGPAIALFLGGYISSLPVDLKETSLSKYDQRWVGAWWLGFLIVGLAAVIFSLPIMFFPRHIRLKKNPDVKENLKESSLRGMLKDLPKSLGRIFRRPIFVLSLVFACIEGFAFSGWFAFAQKYVEVQFNKTSQEVSLITGALCLFSVVLGTFTGGYFTTRLKLEIRGYAVATLAISVITLLIDALYLLFGCKNSEVVGITGSRTSMMDECGCNNDIFLVCGDDNVNYLSPCLAGCTNSTGMTYTNCTAVDNGQVRPGLCELECGFYIPYLLLMFCGYFLGTSGIIPGVMLAIRSIEHRDQSLASGTSTFCQTLLGILPSPIFFGKIIDSACTLWSPSGSCMLYDRERFRFLYQGTSIALRFASIAVIAILLWIAHSQKRSEDSKNENMKGKSKVDTQ